MESRSLDIQAAQVVRWLMHERRTGGLPLSITVTRTYVPETMVREEDFGLGDDETQDLDEAKAVGLLEVSAPSDQNGWVLRVRVEDPFGPRLPDDEQTSDEEEEIDLAQFYEDFIEPDRGIAFVDVDLEDAAAEARFESLLDSIRMNRHAG